MKFHHLTCILAVIWLATSCQKKESETSTAEEPTTTTIELLSHSKGKFAVAETVTLDPDQKGFTIGKKSFTIKNKWDDAEVKHETLNNNLRESHAVELAWSGGEKADSVWLFPIADANAAPALAGTTVQARLLPSGARMAPNAKKGTAEDTQKPLLEGVQFEWKKKRYDIPKLGEEIFSGWKLVVVKIYQHALLNDDATVSESEDAGFTNRAVEVTVEAKDGSRERHICFIDHPQLTTGIHPTILPVTRVSGELASLSRLTVCETLKAPIEKSLLVISPNVEGEGVNVWTWLKGAPAPETKSIDTFPTTVSLGDQKVEIKQHWTKARRQIKWQQRTGRKQEEKQPAILIETGGHAHAKQFVLIKGKATPCKVMGEMIILQYK